MDLWEIGDTCVANALNFKPFKTNFGNLSFKFIELEFGFNKDNTYEIENENIYVDQIK